MIKMKDQDGFSLIEMVIVLFMMGLVFGFFGRLSSRMITNCHRIYTTQLTYLLFHLERNRALTLDHDQIIVIDPDFNTIQTSQRSYTLPSFLDLSSSIKHRFGFTADGYSKYPGTLRLADDHRTSFISMGVGLAKVYMRF